MLPLALLKAEPLVVIIKGGCIGVTGIELLCTTSDANEDLKGLKQALGSGLRMTIQQLY